MSKGKYSPAWEARICDRNCYGDLPALCDDTVTVPYDEKTMFANYDADGFDSYGYSAFDSEGNYVGIGSGVDRLGYTENDYLGMDDDTFDSI